MNLNLDSTMWRVWNEPAMHLMLWTGACAYIQPGDVLEFYRSPTREMAIRVFRHGREVLGQMIGTLDLRA